MHELWQVVNDAIGDSNWMLGDRFSAADIYLFMLTTWLSEEHNHPAVENFPNVIRIIDAVVERPSVRKVYSSFIKERSEA